MPSQEERGARFAALHVGETFLIPNPFDAGSARVLEALGFGALATTSSGLAFTLGRLDSGATLDDVASHVRSLAGATSPPISADLENGYADAGKTTVRATEAARRLGFPFTLTARAENHIRGNPDLDGTVERLQAYERAGADVLNAPGLGTAATSALCARRSASR